MRAKCCRKSSIFFNTVSVKRISSNFFNQLITKLKKKFGYRFEGCPADSVVNTLTLTNVAQVRFPISTRKIVDRPQMGQMSFIQALVYFLQVSGLRLESQNCAVVVNLPCTIVSPHKYFRNKNRKTVLRQVLGMTFELFTLHIKQLLF